MRLRKSGPQRPTNPDITFIRQGDVMTLARLLADHRGRQRFEDRWPALECSLRIFDRYAFAYKTHRGLSAQAPIGQSWAELAVEPTCRTFSPRHWPYGTAKARSARSCTTCLSCR